jgi:hypothetical protein
MRSLVGRFLPLLLFVTALLFAGPLFSGSALAAGPGIEGIWKFVPAKSTDIASWNYSEPRLEISLAGGIVEVIHDWLDRGTVAYADTFAFRPGGTASTSATRSEVWPENWYMGVLASPGDPRTVSGLWVEPARSLRVIARETVRTSQGKTSLTTTREYTLSRDENTLTLTEKRSSRPTPVLLVFERKGPSR